MIKLSKLSWKLSSKVKISPSKSFFVVGDDSDAFADDEAPSSDGMEERDDVSLISTVSSVGEDDSYLSEPTYNNLDPVWAQRHGFGPGKKDIHVNYFTGKCSIIYSGLKQSWERAQYRGCFIISSDNPDEDDIFLWVSHDCCNLV